MNETCLKPSKLKEPYYGQDYPEESRYEEKIWELIMKRFEEKERIHYTFDSNELGLFFESCKKKDPDLQLDVDLYFRDLCNWFKEDTDPDYVDLEKGYADFSYSSSNFYEGFYISFEWRDSPYYNSWQYFKLTLERLPEEEKDEAATAKQHWIDGMRKDFNGDFDMFATFVYENYFRKG